MADVPQMDAVLCRRVWRVAFFSRLEERKGIKVFVDALHKLDFGALSRSQVRFAAHCGWSEYLLASFGNFWCYLHASRHDGCHEPLGCACLLAPDDLHSAYDLPMPALGAD